VTTKAKGFSASERAACPTCGGYDANCPHKGKAGRPRGHSAPTERFTCRVRPEHLRELERAAEAQGLTPSAMGGKVIAEWLELERLGWMEKVR
jgi:hypothetical protein